MSMIAETPSELALRKLIEASEHTVEAMKLLAQAVRECRDDLNALRAELARKRNL